MRTTRTVAQSLVALVGLVLLSSCGGGGGADDSGAPTAGSTGRTETSARSTAATGDCKPGVSNVGGARVVTHCGPASAEVRVGGRTLVFEGGACERGANYLTVNLGRQVMAGAASVDQHNFGFAAGDVSALFADTSTTTPGAVTLVPETTIAPAGWPPADGPFAGAAVVTWADGAEVGMLSGGVVAFSGGVTKGTFSGTDDLGAGKVSGSFDCG